MAVTAAKKRGYGTLVKCDHDDNGTFTTVGYITALTPAARSTKTVDGTTLTDNREVLDPGIAEATDFVFEQFWAIGDTMSTAMDTLLSNANSRTAPYDVDWQNIYPTTADPTTEAFSGWVKNISPAQVVNNEYMKRTITVQTTSASVLT